MEELNRSKITKITRWFEAGLDQGFNSRRPKIGPTTPDVQGDTGPLPYTLWAYEYGQELAARIKSGVTDE
jgi:hypothetical protein